MHAVAIGRARESDEGRTQYGGAEEVDRWKNGCVEDAWRGLEKLDGSL